MNTSMTEYLSIQTVSEMTGVGRTTILYRLREGTGFPQPDAIIRHNKTASYGWLPATINNYINKKEN